MLSSIPLRLYSLMYLCPKNHQLVRPRLLPYHNPQRRSLGLHKHLIHNTSLKHIFEYVSEDCRISAASQACGTALEHVATPLHAGHVLICVFHATTDCRIQIMNENCQCSRLLKSVTRFCRCADTLSSLSVGRRMQTLLHSSCWMGDWCGAVCQVYCKNVCFIQAGFVATSDYSHIVEKTGSVEVSSLSALLISRHSRDVRVLAEGQSEICYNFRRDKNGRNLLTKSTQHLQLGYLAISSIDYCTSEASRKMH